MGSFSLLTSIVDGAVAGAKLLLHRTAFPVAFSSKGSEAAPSKRMVRGELAAFGLPCPQRSNLFAQSCIMVRRCSTYSA